MAKRSITVEWLRANYDYNPETGEFFRKPRKVGYKSLKGKNRDYPLIMVTVGVGLSFYAHRLAWFYMTGNWPLEEIDHINNDSLDNRWSNLREATRSENTRNTNINSKNTSGFTGAYWANDHKHWFSRIGKRGGYLGSFKTAREAGDAYERAAVKKYGKFSHSRFKRF